MGPIESDIEKKLRAELAPVRLEVINESHMHRVPENSETHFKVVVVSEKFRGLSRVRRQQLVYRVLADELAGPVHALSMSTFAPDEEQLVTQSPACSKS